jgi:hypothetical protein
MSAPAGIMRLSRSSKVWWVVLFCASTVALGATTRLVWSGDSDAPRDAASTSLATTFARPEEARRYLNAIAEGDERAVQVLQDALRATKAQPSPDPAQVELLELELAKRQHE